MAAGTGVVTHDVGGAVLQPGHRAERAAHITAEVVNNRPYPRHRGDPHLAELAQVFSHLESINMVTSP